MTQRENCFLICVRDLSRAFLLREEKLEERLQILQGKTTVSAIDKIPGKHKGELGIYFRQLH